MAVVTCREGETRELQTGSMDVQKGLDHTIFFGDDTIANDSAGSDYLVTNEPIKNRKNKIS